MPSFQVTWFSTPLWVLALRLSGAKLTGRWIGCDINKGAIQAARNRIQRVMCEQVYDSIVTSSRQICLDEMPSRTDLQYLRNLLFRRLT